MKPTKEQNDFDAFVAWTRARVLRTSGDLGRADVAEQEARWAVENHAPGFVAFVQLLDTNMTTPDIARATADLEAERAAHAETRRERDDAREYVTHQAADYERRLDNIYKAFTASQNQAKAWQSATGCPSPEAYAARNVEPTEEQVTRLRVVFNDAYEDAHEIGERSPTKKQAAGIRAVLRSLPPMLPSEDEIRASLPPSLVALFDEGRSRMLIRAVHDLIRSRVTAPAPSDEQLAEEAARAANDHLEWPDHPDDRAEAIAAMRGEQEGERWYDLVRFYVRARREGCR